MKVLLNQTLLLLYCVYIKTTIFYYMYNINKFGNIDFFDKNFDITAHVNVAHIRSCD